MNIEIQKSEFVEIEGLTEAAVLSPDENLKVIIRYAELAASHSTDPSIDSDDSRNPINQLRDACFHELCRRHGEDFMLDEGTESAPAPLSAAA